jgi:putative ABC transport system permease protein
MASRITQALRRFSKARASTVTVILTLALTVGLSTTVFSVLDAVFLRPLPYRQPERIFSLRTYSPQGYTQPASYPEFVDWRRVAADFAELAAYNSLRGLNAEFGNVTIAVRAVMTSDNFFEVFAVKPLLGRTFQKGEEQLGREFVTVLSYEIWRDSFGGRTDVLGQRIRMGGRPYTVIGVMPAGFRFPIGQTGAVYFPVILSPNQREGRGNHWLPTVARLASGVSAQAAQQRLSRIFANLGQAYPDTKGRRVELINIATFSVAAPGRPCACSPMQC